MGIFREFYRSFFGKDYTPIWKDVASQNNGTYKYTSGHGITFSHRGYTVIVDEYTHYIVVGHTSREISSIRIRVEFQPMSGGTILVRRQGLIENIGKIFGLKDIKVGNEPLDRKFLIRGDDDYIISEILTEPFIASILVEHPVIRLAVSEHPGLYDEPVGEGKHMLYVVSDEPVKRKNQITEFVALSQRLIDRMTTLGMMKRYE